MEACWTGRPPSPHCFKRDGDHILRIPGGWRHGTFHCCCSGRQGRGSPRDGIRMQGKGFPSPPRITELKQRAGKRMLSFWHQWKDWHRVYRQDMDAWGFGTQPIFTIRSKPDGRVDDVFVDEDEIQRRAGAEFLAGASWKQRLVQERLSAARKISQDIKEGVIQAPQNSTVYYVESPRMQLHQIGSTRALHVPSFLKSPLFAVSVLCISCMIWGIRVLFSDRQSECDLKDGTTTSRRNLDTMRGETLAHVGEVIGQPGDEDSIMKKLEEVRNMARMVRRTENLTPPKSDVELQSCKMVEHGQSQAWKMVTEDESQTNVLLEDSSYSHTSERTVGTSKLSFEKKSVPWYTHTFEGDFHTKPLPANNAILTVAVAENDGSSEYQNIEIDAIRGMIDQQAANVGDFAERASGNMGRMFQCFEKGSSERVDTLDEAEVKEASFKSPGVRPRVIISIEEARSEIAARKERVANAAVSSNLSKHNDKVIDLQGTTSTVGDRGSEKSVHRGNVVSDAALEVDTQHKIHGSKSDLVEGNQIKHQIGHLSQVGAASSKDSAEVTQVAHGTLLDSSGNVLANSLKDDTHMINKELDSNMEKTEYEMAEAEQYDWMKDNVLREIVFKVRANEKAGREPFYGMDNHDEKLFFKGIEEKLQQESKKTNDWINEHVENMDYGLHGIRIDDPPDKYMLRWKDPAKAPKPQSMELFWEQRNHILRERTKVEASPSLSGSRSSQYSSSGTSTHSSSFSSVPSEQSQSSAKSKPFVPHSEKINKKRVVENSTIPTTVTSSSRPLNQVGSSQHTKKWTRDVQMKYDMESNLETKSLMREIGKDLENWVTEEEVEEASKLLSMGAKGEEEYLQREFERVRAKMKDHSDRFGSEAMAEMYKNYQPEKKDHLWWLDLKYVLCIGVLSRTSSDEGLYSLNMSVGVEEHGEQVRNHVVAFEDQNDALKFCYLLESKADELKFDFVKVCPYSPKQLYYDAKEGGFKVTVLKKGQVAVHAGQTIDEVIHQMVEIGSEIYLEKIIQDRSIDADAVLEQYFKY